jgi:hypothetical protein
VLIAADFRRISPFSLFRDYCFIDRFRFSFFATLPPIMQPRRERAMRCAARYARVR